MNFVQGKEQDPIGWTKAKMKDFTEDRLEEDNDQALIPRTNGDRCTQEREDVSPLRSSISNSEITMKHKVPRKKKRKDIPRIDDIKELLAISTLKRFGNERKEVDPPTTCLPRNEYLSLTTKRECIKRNLEKHVQMAFQGDWCDHLNRMLTFYHWEETHRYSILPYAKERHYPLKTSKATSLKAFYFSMKSFLITNPLPLWGCTVDPNL